MGGVVRGLPLILAAVAFLLMLVELLFGSWLFGPDFSDLNVPRNLRWVMDVSHLYPAERRVVYSRDEWGLRGPYPNPAEIDILVIGGSTTEEPFVTDGKTWVDGLRRHFAEAGRPMVVVNAGVSGHSTYGHIASFERWFPLVPGLRARYVLAYVGINDALLQAPTRNDTLAAPADEPPWRRLIMAHSALFRLYRAVKGMVLPPLPTVKHGARREYVHAQWLPVDPPPDLDRARRRSAPLLAAYRQRLAVLAGRIRAFGAVPVFVTQARGDYRVRDGRLYGYRTADGGVSAGGYATITLVNAETLGACRDLAVTCLDLAGTLAFENGDLFDDMHTTPRGSAKVAAGVYRLLAPHVKTRPEDIPRPAPPPQ